MKKSIKNSKHGFHLNSKHWQNYKKSLPCLPKRNNLFQIAVGMVLGDATMSKTGREAYIKFEQGYKQKAFLDHLFSVFKTYCFMEEPGTRLHDGKEKSFWFKTFSHKSFTNLFTLFYQVVDKQTFVYNKADKGASTTREVEDFCQQKKKSIGCQSLTNKSLNKQGVKKKIVKNLIANFLTPLGLAYWIMCDGSLQKNKKTMILHTQGFSKEENEILSNELNLKFKLSTKVISHKVKFCVIEIPSTDSCILFKLISPYIICSMRYKLPLLQSTK